jgi:hypothetical protein
MTTPTYSLRFFPYLRLGLGADEQAGLSQDKLRRTKDVKVNLVDQSGILQTQAHSITLRGPADVIGFQESLVARTEPGNGVTDFESNYFPFVEFKDPDFPWRYSLDTPHNGPCLLPWIILLVLPHGTFDVTRRALDEKQQINVLRVEKAQFDQLPDPQSAWAWAHVHFSAGADLEGGLAASLHDQPEMNCSRLMCPRALESQTAYSAFVVPLYEIGRRAGLGLTLPVPEKIDIANPAWDPNHRPEDENTDVFELPIYYHWDFQTCEAGDFESLLGKIKPGICPPSVGRREVDGGAASETQALQGINDGNFDLEGALLPIGADESAGLKPGEEVARSLAREIQRALASQACDNEDPLITIPAYGQHYQQVDRRLFDPDNIDTSNWIREINLDRRYRVPAGMGTQVVQMNQEEYMDLCWKQVGAIREANEEIRRAAVGRLIGERLEARHLDKLPGGRFVAVMEPFHHYVANGQESFEKQFTRTGLPKGLLTFASRRAFAQRPRLHPSGRNGGGTFADHVQSRLTPALPVGSPRVGLMAASPLRADTVPVMAFPASAVEGFKENFDLTADILSRLNGMITVGAGLQPLQTLEPRMAAPKISYPMYAHLAARSQDYLLPNLKDLGNNTVVLMKENRKFIEAYMVGLNHEMCRELVWREYPTDSRGTIFSYFWEPLGADPGRVDIQPLDGWECRLGENRLAGSQSNASEDPSQVRTIFAVKADLIRRYPDADFYAVEIGAEAVADGSVKWSTFFENYDRAGQEPGKFEDGFRVIPPIISAAIGSDTIFKGYSISHLDLQQFPDKYFFVIAEVPSLPRFGLDREAEPGSGSSEDFSWGQVIFGKGKWIDPKLSAPIFSDATGDVNAITSASIACSTLQLPVRLIIPAARLVQI